MKLVWQRLVDSFFLLLGLVLLLVLIAKIQGHQFLIVVSGSMEPSLPVGSLVMTKRLDFEKFKVGDSISFRSDKKGERIVTHRIIALDSQAHYAKTQGDANDYPDEKPVSAQQIIGKVQGRLPYLGYVVASLQRPLIKWLLFMGLILGLLKTIVSHFFKPKQKQKSKDVLLDEGDVR